MENLIAAIAAEKAELDAHRVRVPGGTTNFDHSQDFELTYTSNAIDHYDAIRYVRELAHQNVPLTEMDVRSLHRLVMLRSDPDIAGRYANQGRYVLTDTGRHSFPSPAEVPSLTRDFSGWLGTAHDIPETAFTAHRQLVEIHPFNDGNGRTARLLMNLVLIRGSYSPISVRPEDRAFYIAALQQAQDGKGATAFDRLLYERLAATLAEYLTAAREALPSPSPGRTDGNPPHP